MCRSIFGVSLPELLHLQQVEVSLDHTEDLRLPDQRMRTRILQLQGTHGRLVVRGMVAHRRFTDTLFMPCPLPAFAHH